MYLPVEQFEPRGMIAYLRVVFAAMRTVEQYAPIEYSSG